MQNLQTIIDDIVQQATTLQNKAANPMSNIWVNASAGTGKTKVLTDRVLRLLLPSDINEGTPPQNILCLTFTKAGANEMIVRVMGILSEWAVCSETKLYEALERLLGHAPSVQQADTARELFATIIDTPEGLNVTTIHAFCQSLLGRFTMEAGLPANFKVMEEQEAAQIIKQTRNGLIQDCLGGHADKDVRDAFRWLASVKNGDQIAKLLAGILDDRHKIQLFFDNCADVKPVIYAILGLSDDDNRDRIFKAYFGDDAFPKSKIEKLAIALGHGTDKNKELGKRLTAFCGASSTYRELMMDEYASIFLTQKNELASTKKITKGAREFDPTVDDIFIDEGERILAYKNHLNSYDIAQSTLKLLVIARDIVGRYVDNKQKLQKLDYDDLIFKTKDLLSGPMRDWILYKLDYRLDHILVDEAQDTSPEQWSIISELLNEFFSGMASRDNDVNRTIFAVGDKKQSIFSFQGADPKVFADVQNQVEERVNQANKYFENIPMDTSFRSTEAVLNTVDKVFEHEDMKRAVAGSIEAYNAHTSRRMGQSGCVELWPLYKSPNDTNADSPWTLPIEVRDAHDSTAAMADRIAQTIWQWIDDKVILKSKHRPINAGDVMILVRRRNALVDHLIRALKKRNVPVSGADRLVVTDHIAVQDILSILSFILMPNDDLSLAEILKSPFIGLDDKQIERIAFGRGGTLWDALKSSSHDKIISYLKRLIESASGKNAFAAISDILNLETPNQSRNGWQAVMSRLGEDAIDPIEELLTMAQNYDANDPAGGLQGFVAMAKSNKADIKRELEGAGDMVRIMTVHASKGLQAPIVFLPDTMSVPKSPNCDGGFVWLKDSVPLWYVSADGKNDLMKSFNLLEQQGAMDEYNRLLYVAMTRAEDRLIACGALNKQQKSAPEGCWYDSIQKGIGHMDFKEIDWPYDDDYMIEDAKHIIYETDQIIDGQQANQNDIVSDEIPLPQWARTNVRAEQHPPKILRPSQDQDDAVPVQSPLRQIDDAYKFRRGLLTHSLLQYLPDIDIENRHNVGESYLNKQAPDVSVDIKQSILSEVMTILNDPQFMPYFGEGSYAEVPVTGVVDDMIISGQIDRMLVGETDIWIVDFKSNRPPPRDPNKIPAVYRKQLAAYRTLIADMYPQHKIHTALLWTDGPDMMIIE